MLVPAGGSPPPHRHEFEEMFSVLEGETELTCRGNAERPMLAPVMVLVGAVLLAHSAPCPFLFEATTSGASSGDR